ncbi:MAG TPA: deoxyribodipyrimidine photolyase, partial [Planctomycetes bacterium]|nr:deoxyribodipyrimidine photolyase [Planctomycetota bacterium]
MDLVSELPQHLAERVRRVDRAAAPPADADLVVYWMRTAARADENPALDVACWLANRLQLPLLVYHALSERYPYACDRHHTFVLEGARDVARDLAARGIRHAFHLEREGRRGPHLSTLVKRAALVVTEDMPIAFLETWTQRLAQGPAPVLAVDSACLVPMNAVSQAHTRAFRFRSATKRERRARLGRPWPEIAHLPPPYEGELPFSPLDLADADLPALVASCRIDHSVAPIPGTRGGSRAGYERWDAFRRAGLDRYATRRDDPLEEGVSRLSAYLHYGMVSPLRIAREAHQRGGKGAEKFLDELLIWRELAYAFCRHVPDHESLAALPAWALATLREHEGDPRPALLDEETLERARSGDALWDAAQASLRIHGELHNNVRMTWGKALLRWTPDAATALRRLVDLNHRFALDGRDPASYGGILWCLGQFDRPFPPGAPILGEVRDRTTQQHARRLDVRAYAASCHAPALDPAPRALVIGAGLAGLICARTLRDHGLEVEVLSAGPGRCATHRSEDGAFAFDPGL